MLEDEANMCGDRLVAQGGVARLDQVANTERDQGGENGKRQDEGRKRLGVPRRSGTLGR